ncbi:hypothetical protein TDIS_0508 [Thermosulfurimonas dismutans]|uniref:Uncharacterized protein n=1 Tax=Thermosulfurimonas dismutans TaxID=999894 RepID=A0A179D6R0_9BACT|nr:hypothetical protein TDIS_0508 [Thermosulfurimonas dismutans]
MKSLYRSEAEAKISGNAVASLARKRYRRADLLPLPLAEKYRGSLFEAKHLMALKSSSKTLERKRSNFF